MERRPIPPQQSRESPLEDAEEDEVEYASLRMKYPEVERLFWNGTHRDEGTRHHLQGGVPYQRRRFGAADSALDNSVPCRLGAGHFNAVS